jgi:uncharacterized Zn-finger protein
LVLQTANTAVSSTSSINISELGKEFAKTLGEEVSPDFEETPSAPTPLQTDLPVTLSPETDPIREDPSYRIPKLSRPTLSIRKKQAVALELKKLREEKRLQQKTTLKFTCKVCKITCNSRASFREHAQSRKHKNAKSLKKGYPKCERCNREFESEHHLERHLRGKDHLKVVTALARSK